MTHLYEPDDEGGKAGDTGSATHVAVAEFHRGKGGAECLAAMQSRIAEYPKADLQDAAGMFLKYASDPVNRDATVVLVEEAVRFRIKAHESDPTGAEIEVEGRVDQVRQERGSDYVWDLKTSKKDPTTVLAATVHQMAGYCIGASIKLGRPVHPGGVIMPRQKNMMHHYPWRFQDIEQILLGVRVAVANIRRGILWHVPNDGCIWCAAKSPDACLPVLHQLNKELLACVVASDSSTP